MPPKNKIAAAVPRRRIAPASCAERSAPGKPRGTPAWTRSHNGQLVRRPVLARALATAAEDEANNVVANAAALETDSVVENGAASLEAGSVVANAAVFGRREAATLAYIKEHAAVAGDENVDYRKGKLLVFIPPAWYHSKFRYIGFYLTANIMLSLTLPVSEDGMKRSITSGTMDAFVQHLRRRRQGGVQIVRNGRRVLLQCSRDRAWIEKKVGNSGTELTKEDHDDIRIIRLLAHQYLQHDLVFIPIAHRFHSFVAVLNFGEREYQILDSANYGIQFYEQGMSAPRDYLGRCMAMAGREDVAGWGLRKVEGLPKQTDKSSCALFALLFMQLWDGDKLTRNFSMDDVHVFRMKLAEVLVFSELNRVENVKEEIERRMIK